MLKVSLSEVAMVPYSKHNLAIWTRHERQCTKLSHDRQTACSQQKGLRYAIQHLPAVIHTYEPYFLE